MSLKFNPLTGALDLVNFSSSYKQTQVVDAPFLLAPAITLVVIPVIQSEIVFLNGLEIDDTNYSISGNILTMITTQLILGDILYIKFND